MAYNPLYPGYEPIKDAESNPLYPGYFPGKPMPNKKRPQGKFVEPIPEFGFQEGVNSFLDEFGDALSAPAMSIVGLPKWVGDRMVDDFKSSFTIKANLSDDIPTYILDDYSATDLPGAASISLDLNPIDLIKDPKKKIFGEVKKLIKAPFNTGDYEVEARRQVWSELIKPVPFESIAATKLVRGFQESVKDAASPLNLDQGSSNPLALMGGVYRADTRVRKGAKALVSTHRDPFSNVGAAYIDYINNYQSTLGRNKAHNNFMTKTLEAIAAELTDKAGSFSPDEQGKVQRFLKHADVVGSVQEMATIQSKITGDLKKAMLKTDAVERKKAMDGISAFIQGNGSVEDFLGKAGKGFNTGSDTLVDRIDLARRNMGEVQGKGIYSIEQLAQLETTVNFFGGLSSDETFEKFRDLSANESTFKRVFSSNAEALLKKVEEHPGKGSLVKGKVLRGGDPFKPSLESEMLRKLVEGELLSQEGIGGILSSKDGMVSERLKFYAASAMVDNKLAEFTQVMNAIQKGPSVFTERFIWSRLRKVIAPNYSIRSPSEWIKAGVSKFQHFSGLVLKPGKEPVLFKKALLNKFSINIKGVKGIGSLSGLMGGKPFEHVHELVSIIKGMENKTSAVTTNLAFKALMGTWKVPGRRLVDLDQYGHLVGLSTFSKTVMGLSDFSMAELEDLQKLEVKIAKFREHMLDFLKNKYGEKRAAELWNNSTFVKQTILGIGSTLGHTREHYGFLQKYGRWATKIQQNKFVKAVMNPTGFLKDALLGRIKNLITKSKLIHALEEKLLKLLSKQGFSAFLKAVGGALGATGVGLIGTAILWAAEWIITKILDLVKSLYKKFKKFLETGDLEVWIEDLEKKTIKKLKKVFMVVLFIVLIARAINIDIPGSGVFRPFVPVKSPFSQGIPFALSTFAVSDPTRLYSTKLQSFDWSIYSSPDGLVGGGYAGGTGYASTYHVEGECGGGDYTLLKQCDPDWKEYGLGGMCSDDPATMCNSGCGLLSATMLMRNQKPSVTPVDTFLNHYGGFISGCGTGLDQAGKAVAAELGVGVEYDYSCTVDDLKRAICEGDKVAIILVDSCKDKDGSCSTTGGHFVVAIGVVNDAIAVLDPYYPKDILFDGKSDYGSVRSNPRGCAFFDRDSIQ